jgi:hypothetical protein
METRSKSLGRNDSSKMGSGSAGVGGAAGPGSGIGGRGASIGAMGEGGGVSGTAGTTGWNTVGVAGRATAPERDHDISGAAIRVGVHWASAWAGSGGTGGAVVVASTWVAGRIAPPVSTHSWGRPLQADTTRTTRRRGRVSEPVGRTKSTSPGAVASPPETETESRAGAAPRSPGSDPGSRPLRGANRYGANFGPSTLVPAGRAARSRTPGDPSVRPLASEAVLRDSR